MVSGFVIETDQMSAKSAIVDFILWIEDEEDKVETRHEGVRQLDVLDNSSLVIPLGLDRIGGSQD